MCILCKMESLAKGFTLIYWSIGTPTHSALHQQWQEEEDCKQANMEVNKAELEILENQLCR